MVMVYFVTAPFVDLPAIATRIKEATAASDKPVTCVVCTIEKWAALIHQLRGSGIPVYSSPRMRCGASPAWRAISSCATVLRPSCRS